MGIFSGKSSCSLMNACVASWASTEAVRSYGSPCSTRMALIERFCRSDTTSEYYVVA